MHINLSKTSILAFGTRQNLKNSDLINIYLSDEIYKKHKQTTNKNKNKQKKKLTKKTNKQTNKQKKNKKQNKKTKQKKKKKKKKPDTQRPLGITINKTLTWDFQIDSICLNVARRITLMKQLSKYVNKESLKQYYISYVLPIFDYGCIIWSRCSVGNTNRLLKLQKRAARIILRCDILTPSENMFKELQCLSFPKQVQYHTIVMMHKALNGQAPAYISNMFIKTSDIHNRCLRSGETMSFESPSLDHGTMKTHFL